MDIRSVDLNNINLGHVNFDQEYPETIILVRLMVWCNRFKQCKAFKKELGKKLMPIAQHRNACSIAS